MYLTMASECSHLLGVTLLSTLSTHGSFMMSVHTCTCTYLRTLLGVTLLSTRTCTHIHLPAYTHNCSLSPPVITHLVSNKTLVLLPDPPSCLALTCCWQVGRVWGTMLTKPNHKTIKGYPWIRLYTYKLAHTCTSIHTHAQYIHTFIYATLHTGMLWFGRRCSQPGISTLTSSIATRLPPPSEEEEEK